jgi:hypothetical protein
MNHFNLPNFKEWLRFFGWVAMKLLVSFLQFLALALEKILEVFLYCTKMSQKTLTKIAFVVDHLPYSGVPLAQHNKLEAIEVEALPASIDIKFFDFTELKSNPDKFPHIRVVGKSGVGKTRFTEWIMDMLGGEQFVITPKKKPTDWINHKVYGYPFNYQECEKKLEGIHKLMHIRYADMEKGKQLNQINFACDEWKLINRNVDAAKDLMKDIIIVARDAKIRLLAMAQGENVATWGLEGESDLEECFTTVRFGEFALDYCKSLRNKYRKDSTEFSYYSAVLLELESQGFRCCMIDSLPAKVPDLSNWKPTSHPEICKEMELQKVFANEQKLNEYELAILHWGKNHPNQILKARDAANNISLFKSTCAEDIRIIFQALADKGVGFTEGEGNRLGWLFKEQNLHASIV